MSIKIKNMNDNDLSQIKSENKIIENIFSNLILKNDEVELKNLEKDVVIFFNILVKTILEFKNDIPISLELSFDNEEVFSISNYNNSILKSKYNVNLSNKNFFLNKRPTSFNIEENESIKYRRMLVKITAQMYKFENRNKVDSVSGNNFYDCNLPEEKEGYKLIEVDTDIYKYVKINDLKNIENNRNIYLKWSFSKDISIVYYIFSEKEKEKERKYFIKSYSENSYSEIEENIVNIMLKEMNFITYEEIISFNSEKEFVTYILDGNTKMIKKETRETII